MSWLIEEIESAELNFRQKTEEFFSDVWGNTLLHSHNIDHHRRVWHYAKEILLASAPNGQDDLGFTVRGLLLACFLHDIGLSRERGVRHGAASRVISSGLISGFGIGETEYLDILDAIEHHDDKDYIILGRNPELLKTLSIADDLDAFGYIGIFRYLEIYSERGVPPEKTGYEILKNAGGRFLNFQKSMKFPAWFNKKHEERYNLLTDFFRNYNMIAEEIPGSAGLLINELLSAVREIVATKSESKFSCNRFRSTGFSDNSVIAGMIDDFSVSLCLEIKEFDQPAV